MSTAGPTIGGALVGTILGAVIGHYAAKKGASSEKRTRAAEIGGGAGAVVGGIGGYVYGKRQASNVIGPFNPTPTSPTTTTTTTTTNSGGNSNTNTSDPAAQGSNSYGDAQSGGDLNDS